MCIAYLAIGVHADWPLVIAANRDEFHHRPTLAAAAWSDHPHIIAGRDLEGMGTWLGATRDGRYALLTNYRDPGRNIALAPSRGKLVSDFLVGDAPPQHYINQVHAEAQRYNGFNLIVGDLKESWYIGNRHRSATPMQMHSGRYVLSNHVLDTPWPKAKRLRRALDAVEFEQLTESLDAIFAALRDNTPAQDQDLPQTGLTLERERLLSSPFIISPDYGTRCSTVLIVHRSGRALFSELSYDPQGQITQRHDWPFTVTWSAR